MTRRSFQGAAIVTAIGAVMLMGAGVGASADQSDDAEFDRAVVFRSRLGLRADDSYVARSFTDAEAFASTSWGVPLTTDEAADLDGRAETIGRFTPAVAYAQRQDDYAGMYYDQLSGGIPVFEFTAQLDHYRSEIRDIVGNGDFLVVQAERTMRALESLSADIVKDASSWEEQGISITDVGPSSRGNTVVIGLSKPRAGAANDLRSEYGDFVDVEVVGETQADCASRTDCADPLKGGLRIHDHSFALPSGRCTSAIWGKIPSGSHVLLTAGHCLDVDVDNSGNPVQKGDVDTDAFGHHWEHVLADPDIGTGAYETYFAGSDLDVGYINTATLYESAPYNQIFGQDSSDIWSIKEVIQNSGQPQGALICRSFINAPKWVCGDIEDANHGHNVEGRWIGHLWKVPWDAHPGDSGGPYLRNTYYTPPGVFVKGFAGVHNDSSLDDWVNGQWVSQCGQDCHSWYSTGENIEAFTSISICTSASC